MALIEMLFNQDVTIWRRTREPDGQGGWLIDYVEVEQARGRLRPASDTEREEALREQRAISHVLYLLHGTDIVRGDQVNVDGIVLDVLGIREPSRAGYHIEVDCAEQQAEVALEAGS